MGLFSFIGDLLGGGSADDAAEASIEASNVAAGAQREALDYLKQINELPIEIRNDVLRGLGDYYQVPGTQLTQEQLIQQAYNSPLYTAIMGGQKEGNDTILRNASATGGLRSGNIQHNFMDFNTNLSNRALLESFNQAQERQDYERALQLSGLHSLAGLQTNEAGIAGLMAGIGQTQAQGILGAAQAQQQGSQNVLGNLLGLGQLGVAAYSAFSDIRLKRDIVHIGKRGRFNWYRWKWSKKGQEILNLPPTGEGVLAHEVYEKHPDAVGLVGGFLVVDYERLAEAA